MTTAFQRSLNNARSQQQVLEPGDEEAVKQVVVLPFLQSIGWNTANLTEVYPQAGFPNSKDKVDYALQIKGESRVFIEVKRWSLELTHEHEKQLLDYCRAAKTQPKLAFLTNGRHWQFYLHPTEDHPGLRLFLVLNIISDESDEVESQLREFLARKRIKSMQKAPRKAYNLWDARVKDETIMKALIDAWNKLTRTPREKIALLKRFTSSREKIQQADEAHIKRFLDSNAPLFNPVSVTPKSTKTQSRPSTFTLKADDWQEDVQVNYWYEVHFELCKIVFARHPDKFSDQILKISDAWFSKSPENGNDYLPIEGSDVWIKKTGANAQNIKNLCDRILAQFNSNYVLTIQEA